MPQMAPLHWIFLFLLFLMIYLIFIMNNYYIFSLSVSKPLTKTLQLYPHLFHWKW